MNQVYTMAGMTSLHQSPGPSLPPEFASPLQEGSLSLSVADLREEIWREVAHWQVGGAGLGRTYDLAALTAAPCGAATLQPLPLRSLLALDGPAFIAAAYHTMLGRPPDKTGFTQLTAELDRGRSKVDILRGIQLSNEARERGESLRGLHVRYLAQRLRRPPAALLRLSRRMLRVPDGPRQRDRAAPPQPADGWSARLEQRLSEQQAALHLITARLSALQAAQEELGRKTLAALSEQDRLLRNSISRDPIAAEQVTVTEDELVTAASSLSDELGALSRRLAAIELEGMAPRQSEPARLS